MRPRLDSKRLGDLIVFYEATQAPLPRPFHPRLLRFAAQRCLAPDQIAVIDVSGLRLRDLQGPASLVEWMVRNGGVILFARIDQARPEVREALRVLDAMGEWAVPRGSSVQVIWASPHFHPVFSGARPAEPFRNYAPASAF